MDTVKCFDYRSLKMSNHILQVVIQQSNLRKKQKAKCLIPMQNYQPIGI